MNSVTAVPLFSLIVVPGCLMWLLLREKLRDWYPFSEMWNRQCAGAFHQGFICWVSCIYFAGARFRGLYVYYSSPEIELSQHFMLLSPKVMHMGSPTKVHSEVLMVNHQMCETCYFLTHHILHWPKPEPKNSTTVNNSLKIKHYNALIFIILI